MTDTIKVVAKPKVETKVDVKLDEKTVSKLNKTIPKTLEAINKVVSKPVATKVEKKTDVVEKGDDTDFEHTDDKKDFSFSARMSDEWKKGYLKIGGIVIKERKVISLENIKKETGIKYLDFNTTCSFKGNKSIAEFRAITELNEITHGNTKIYFDNNSRITLGPVKDRLDYADWEEMENIASQIKENKDKFNCLFIINSTICVDSLMINTPSSVFNFIIDSSVSIDGFYSRNVRFRNTNITCQRFNGRTFYVNDCYIYAKESISLFEANIQNVSLNGNKVYLDKVSIFNEFQLHITNRNIAIKDVKLFNGSFKLQNYYDPIIGQQTDIKISKRLDFGYFTGITPLAFVYLETNALMVENKIFSYDEVKNNYASAKQKCIDLVTNFKPNNLTTSNKHLTPENEPSMFSKTPYRLSQPNYTEQIAESLLEQIHSRLKIIDDLNNLLVS